jgi:pimeloyl-ACP methyl ester carboxylesterase
LKEFSKDYRTVAIDMRGYGDTDKPVGVDQYNMELLREDIIQLVKILSPSRGCVLVGHDWGGVLGW